MSLKAETMQIKFEKNDFQQIRDLDQANFCNKRRKAIPHHPKDSQCIRKWIDNQD